jgi:hypothetical protein
MEKLERFKKARIYKRKNEKFIVDDLLLFWGSLLISHNGMWKIIYYLDD